MQTYQTVPYYVKVNDLTIHCLLTLSNTFTCHFPSNSTSCLFLKTLSPHYAVLKAIESIEFLWRILSQWINVAAIHLMNRFVLRWYCSVQSIVPTEMRGLCGVKWSKLPFLSEFSFFFCAWVGTGGGVRVEFVAGRSSRKMSRWCT